MASIVNAILSAMAALLSAVYGLIDYAALQTRIATATDGFLDLIAQDFFGSTLARRPAQSDGSFRARIQASLFVIRNSRPAMTQALERLTGRAPIIVEPWNTGDTGALDSAGLYWDDLGGWGASVPELPYQSFVTAFRPQTIGNADLAGWDVTTGGWDAGHEYWADESSSTITDADIIATVEAVRMAGTVVWLGISN